MLHNFFRTSKNYKQRVNKKENALIDSFASSGGQATYM